VTFNARLSAYVAEIFLFVHAQNYRLFEAVLTLMLPIMSKTDEPPTFFTLTAFTSMNRIEDIPCSFTSWFEFAFLSSALRYIVEGMLHLVVLVDFIGSSFFLLELSLDLAAFIAKINF